ncbi:MAG TPA: energy transducer TonB [Thermomonas sp.]|nr:energy transducer TonB [Thermomonas sp.]
MRAIAAIVLLGGFLTTAGAVAGGRASKAVREQVESSLQLSGTITIGKDGSVLAHTLDPQAPLGEPLTAFVQKAVAGWRFVPIMVDGQAVNARVPMHLRLVAKRAEDDKVSVTIASSYFGSNEGMATTDNPGSTRLAPPQYPKVAQRMGGEGTVYLIVQVDRGGKVANVDAEQVNLRVAGTKNEMTRLRDMLTAAAVRAARDWTFTPPTTGETANDDHWLIRVPVDFVLLGPGDKPRKEGGWDTYIPGPRNMGMPWAQEKLKTAGSPDALPGNGAYPLRQGATLLTPLG